MDFGFNDEQRAIKETAREMLAKRCPMAKVREAAEARRYDNALWDEIRQLGWPGITVPEEHGGQGLGMVELAILCEELGYACAPSPFLSNASAGLFIGHAGSDEQMERWLPGIASGGERAAAAFEPRSNDLVPDAAGASVLVLNHGNDAVLVDVSDAEIEPVELIDATRGYARVSSADGGDPLPGDVEGAADLAVVALAAELTGISQRAMEMAVEYAKEREQFDRPIGSYQAVSHRCAEMLYDTEEARSLTYYAAWCADAQGEKRPAGAEGAADSLPMAASMAKARASEAAWRVSASALQVHGGIGFTWEHDLHFLLKRAKLDAELLGDPRKHRERVATLAGLG
jgi:alkylation response protein AidB-like acyl-CoA dehydrogenase